MATNENLISGWDWANKHVQPRDQISESRFINGATVLISAGPPRLSGASDPNFIGPAAPDSGSAGGGSVAVDNIVFPIGVCLDANISQQRALQRLYEIGSDRSYFIQGRSAGGISLNRVLFNGANILRVLYAYYPQSKIGALGSVAGQASEYSLATSDYADEKALDSIAKNTTSDENKSLQYTGEKNLPPINMNPGHNNYYINLASDLFTHPLGLMFTFQDNNKRTMASFYCEMCFVASHGMQINANAGSMVAETVQMQFDRIAPIRIS